MTKLKTNTLEEKVPFDFIRYANCWEDAAVLLKGLDPKSGSKILSIGSAGDNSFSLLTTNPELVVAVDINPSQLFLIELKKNCFLHLDYQTTLEFLGFQSSSQRLEIYKSIADKLSSDAKRFWDYNQDALKNGIIHQGKFERYFQYFAQKVLPFIHSKKTVTQLLSPKSESEQAVFYSKKWNNWRWRLFFKIFFSKYIMGKYGRDPQFLKEVEINVGNFIFNQAAKELSSLKAQDNFILHYNLTGDFGNLLPHYLKEENFQLIKDNCGALQLEKGYAEVALTKYGKMDAMNLSNIFEYMDQKTFHSTSQELVEGLNTEGKIAYWNLMVPRMISRSFSNEIVFLDTLSNELKKKDKGFFYHKFVVEQRK